MSGTSWMMCQMSPLVFWAVSYWILCRPEKFKLVAKIRLPVLQRALRLLRREVLRQKQRNGERSRLLTRPITKYSSNRRNTTRSLLKCQKSYALPALSWSKSSRSMDPLHAVSSKSLQAEETSSPSVTNTLALISGLVPRQRAQLRKKRRKLLPRKLRKRKARKTEFEVNPFVNLLFSGYFFQNSSHPHSLLISICGFFFDDLFFYCFLYLLLIATHA